MDGGTGFPGAKTPDWRARLDEGPWCREGSAATGPGNRAFVSRSAAGVLHEGWDITYDPTAGMGALAVVADLYQAPSQTHLKGLPCREAWARCVRSTVCGGEVNRHVCICISGL